MLSSRLTSLAVGVLVAGTLASGACGKHPGREVSVTRAIPYTAAAELDVYRPQGITGLPVIVTLHGCCGTRENLNQLNYELAGRGTVVFNVSWRGTDSAAGGYPGAYEEAACAVAFARATAKDHGGDPRRVTLVGWSDGALVAGVAANAGDDFSRGCRVGGAKALPDAFVALGGFLGWQVGDGGIDPTYVNDRTIRYFGGTPEEAPAAWAGGNPYTHLGRNRALQIRLVVGEDDPLLLDDRCFARAAEAAGHQVGLTVVSGVGQQSILSPRYPEGALAVREILAAAKGEVPPALTVAAEPAGACPGTGIAR